MQTLYFFIDPCELADCSNGCVIIADKAECTCPALMVLAADETTCECPADMKPGDDPDTCVPSTYYSPIYLLI